MPLLLVSNPVCGNGTGHQFVQQHVVPLLEAAGHKVDKVVVTTEPGHAGRAMADEMQQTTEITLVLSSGDGTLQEVVDACTKNHWAACRSNRKFVISLVMIPTGTANALFSALFPPTQGDVDLVAYKLKSVKAFLEGSHTIPLTLAVTSIEGPGGPRDVIGVVVTSTCLHASILHDSEELRHEIPDMSRFKIAAANNITRWYGGKVNFLAARSGHVYIYDGPFEYFLATPNVDRLEPAFQITPLKSRIPPEDKTMDAVVVRPLRDKAIQGSSEDDRKKFSNTAKAILMGAYQQGSHVDMKYGDNGAMVVAEGEYMVEYLRCGGWEWIPDDDDAAAHLLCVDGAIFRIERGGKASCCTLEEHEGPLVRVYA
ncbi:hypothetical protein BD410DRAFT_77866 [Rickenella mellea]|uniref:DAGKc domain-containing protein n=1 Tax=Rickenella mellea TaxID=50990 RepID=A0A4Y7QCB8_9AGAM|nr:hypothetical protein BD410DRAFT_77866 [Rickenella mellea]